MVRGVAEYDESLKNVEFGAGRSGHNLLLACLLR
jgi:hypothetical protein